jgi:hypothetical protein
MPSFDEIRKSASNAANSVSNVASTALDRAKLVTGISTENVEEQQQLSRLEELSEYCPKLTFQQVRLTRVTIYLMWTTSYRQD